VSRLTVFDVGASEVIEGVAIAMSRPVPRKHAVVLACVKDEPGGGRYAPILDAPLRAPALMTMRPGRGNGSAGGRTRELGQEE